MENMIPLSVVDALLTSKEQRLNELEDKAHWCLEVEIDLLKTIKKEAIPSPSPEPLSSLICPICKKEFDSKSPERFDFLIHIQKEANTDSDEVARILAKMILEQSGNKIEQKIRDILEEHKTCCSKKLMYKELRKLLE